MVANTREDWDEITAEGLEEHVAKPVPPFQHIQDMGVNLSTREMFVTGEITDDFGCWFTAALRYLETQGNAPVVVWLNTPGGDVQSMFTFHDLVRASSCEVTTIGTGQVCSAGVLMLACGHKRLVTESCILMSHRSEESMTGNLEDMESYLKVIKWAEEHWSVLMDRYTPDEVDGKVRDARYWFQLGKKNAEWWITGGDSIIREGLADEIYNFDKLPESARKSSKA